MGAKTLDAQNSSPQDTGDRLIEVAIVAIREAHRRRKEGGAWGNFEVKVTYAGGEVRGVDLVEKTSITTDNF